MVVVDVPVASRCALFCPPRAAPAYRNLQVLIASSQNSTSTALHAPTTELITIFLIVVHCLTLSSLFRADHFVQVVHFFG